MTKDRRREKRSSWIVMLGLSMQAIAQSALVPCAAGDRFILQPSMRNQAAVESPQETAPLIDLQPPSVQTRATPPALQPAMNASLGTARDDKAQSPPECDSLTLSIPVQHVAQGHRSAARTQLASRISQQIIGDSDNLRERAVRPSSNVLGWDAVELQLKSYLRRCDELSARGVFLSAREEANLALLLLARHLDHVSNRFASEPEIHSAKAALRESNDFTSSSHLTDIARLREIVCSHETDMLKQSDWNRVSPRTLAGHYRTYAEQQLVSAAQGHPWFADVYYKLGRTYQAQADHTVGMESENLQHHAAAFYRAALGVQPDNSLAANQLAYVLLQQGRPEDAQQIALASVKAKPDAPSLQNLAEASRRMNDLATWQWAVDSLSNLARTTPQQRSMTVIEVMDNATFASFSPMAIGPQPTAQPGQAQPHPSPINPATSHTAGSMLPGRSAY